MAEDKTKKEKGTKKRVIFADKAMVRYNQLLKMKEDFEKEFKPLEQFLVKMGRIERKTKKKKS